MKRRNHKSRRRQEVPTKPPPELNPKLVKFQTISEEGKFWWNDNYFMVGKEKLRVLGEGEEGRFWTNTSVTFQPDDDVWKVRRLP